nr:reverse transcriptase domain-containing protein [Escherichia coli]
MTIPKPGGGERLLGIPTVVDRFIQQAMMQVLQAQWDATFSDSSYGFRPGRSAHQAVKQAQKYIESGYSWGLTSIWKSSSIGESRCTDEPDSETSIG